MPTPLECRPPRSKPYPKVTVDQKGRVTAGTLLVAADLPSHTHTASDIVSGSLPFKLQKGGADVGTRRALNFIEGSDVTITVADDTGNDRVNVTIAAAGGSANHNLLSATHPDTVAASPALGDLITANGTPAWARLAGNTTTTRKFLRQTGTGSVSALPAWDTLVAGDLPSHTHAEVDITGLLTDLAGKAASVHTHTSSQISDASANPTAGTVVLRDGSGGASFTYAAVNNLWAYLDSHLNSIECGPFQSVGGPYENMAKYSEDFSVATWDKNGGTCTVSANSVVAPDGNQTADVVTASGSAGLIRQNIAGLVANGQYTFYVWLKVPSGTMTISIGILDNGWTTWLVGPIAVTLTTSWQRFKVTGTMTGGATSLWIAIGHYSDG